MLLGGDRDQLHRMEAAVDSDRGLVALINNAPIVVTITKASPGTLQKGFTADRTAHNSATEPDQTAVVGVVDGLGNGHADQLGRGWSSTTAVNI